MHISRRTRRNLARIGMYGTAITILLMLQSPDKKYVDIRAEREYCSGDTVLASVYVRENGPGTYNLRVNSGENSLYSGTFSYPDDFPSGKKTVDILMPEAKSGLYQMTAELSLSDKKIDSDKAEFLVELCQNGERTFPL